MSFDHKHTRFGLVMFLLIMTVSFALHLSQFNKDLIGIHLWRQTQTQLNTLQFYRHDFNILNPRTNMEVDWHSNIQRFEFPLVQWLIAAVMKIFGEAIIVTRLCYFIIGMFTVLGMYRLLKLLAGNETGSWLGAYALAISPVFFYYTINPLPDNGALCAATWYLYFFLRYLHTNKLADFVYSAVFICIAGLTKLPYLLFAAGAGYYLLRHIRQKDTLRLIGIYMLSAIPVIAWYQWSIPDWTGNGVLYGIFKNKISFYEYYAILVYHGKQMFPKLLLNEVTSVLFIIGALMIIFTHQMKKEQYKVLFWSGIACIAYWLLELNMIDIIHDYYMMPFLPFLFIIIGFAIIYLWQKHIVFKWGIVILLITSTAITYGRTQKWWTIEKSYCNPDIILYKDDLRAAVPSDSLCFVAKDACPYIFAYMFDKMGYYWLQDTYPPEFMKDIIDNRGVHYMYCSVRSIDSAENIKPFLDELIMQRGSIKVWKLKTAEIDTTKK